MAVESFDEQAKYGVVLVTVSSTEEGRAIAQELITQKLAACISMFPIQSIYTWQGTVEQDEEWQLVIKTDLNQFQTLETTIQQLHSYDVPEILALPVVKGSQPYLNWISEQVN